MKRIIGYLILLLYIGFVNDICAQTFSNKESEEYRKAINYFQENNYRQALPLFENLINKYSKDPAYQYYTGICMISCNVNINTAIEYLKYASVKSVPYNVYLYLGNAYHLTGNFSEAIKYYNRFTAYAKRNEVEEMQVDLLVEQCKTGISLSENISNKLYPKLAFAEKYLENYLNKLSIGLFYRAPVLLKDNENDNDNFKTEIINYIPKNISIDQKFYESGIIDKKMGIDLFVAKISGKDNWIPFENAGNIINSPYDDAYPFFDEKNKLLYFSNNGTQSMGGYDILISKFDNEKKEWLPPVNPGFPINSPSDDYLFVLNNLKNEAYFVSNRNVYIDSVELFELKYSGKDLKFTDLLGNSYRDSSTTQMNFNKIFPYMADNISVSKITSDSVFVENNEEIKTEENDFMELSYDELINTALVLQLRADSFIRVSKGLREEMKLKNSSQDKSLLYREIKKLENRASSLQERTDILYQHSRELELNLSEDFSSEFDKNYFNEEIKSINKKESINNLKEVEKYDKPNKNKVTLTSNQESNELSNLINQFEILSKTPYSDDNPIPINVKLINGVIYRIQLGAFSKSIKWDNFGGLTPISGEAIPERNIIKYYVGLFTSTKLSIDAVSKVKNYGYKDAFIVAYFNGKKVPLQRARELELSLAQNRH